MPGQVKEGWYEDPASRHQYRWFSAGLPTDLVKDGPATSRDALSMSDPALFTSMDLAKPPDDSPLLRTQHAAAPLFEPLDLVFGQSYADSKNPAYFPQPGWLEMAVAFIPFLIGIYLLSLGSLVPGIVAMALSPVVAAFGRQRRVRQLRRSRHDQRDR
jgi:hypothetical protein